MGSMTIWHWILVLAVGLLLVSGRGPIADLMGDFAKGIQSFKNPINRGGRVRVEGLRRNSMPAGTGTGFSCWPSVCCCSSSATRSLI
jgi:hypothetical protein